jgi:hypothetical protein
MTEQNWTWWQKALAGEKQPVHESEPQAGFYRVRSGRGGPWIPVAIWQDETGFVALKNGQPADAMTAWTWVCQNPVTHEAYTSAVEGRGWPDDAPILGSAPGSNLPESDLERLKLLIEAEETEAEAFLKDPITDQILADKAASWADRVAALAKEAENCRVAEKKPIDDLSKEVQAKWKPVVDRGTDLTKKLKKHIEPFLLEQDRLKREAEAKALAERQAEEAKLKAEIAAKEQSGEPVQPIQFIRPSAPAKAPNISAGRTGAKISLHTVKVAVITDYDKLLISLKHDGEIIELVTKLANRSARANVALEGMTIAEEKKV